LYNKPTGCVHPGTLATGTRQTNKSPLAASVLSSQQFRQSGWKCGNVNSFPIWVPTGEIRCYKFRATRRSSVRTASEMSLLKCSVKKKKFVHSFVRSFFRSFIYSFVRSFFRSFFVRSFVHSFISSFISSFVRSFIFSFIHLFILSFFLSFVHSSFVHSFISSFISLFVRSFFFRSFVHSFILLSVLRQVHQPLPKRILPRERSCTILSSNLCNTILLILTNPKIENV
jgi:hypothetical protein